MNRILSLFSAIVLFVASIGGIIPRGVFNKFKRMIIPPTEIAVEEISSDSWTATDGLGRTLPTYDEVGNKDSQKFVGLFYWIWHENFAVNHPARNTQQILSLHPEAINDFSSTVWGSVGNGIPYFWNEPMFGYYTSIDEYVLRKHAEMIADAGVDVIIFDCTNGTYTWEESYEVLFRVFEEAKLDGVNVPKVAFILPFNDGSDSRTSLINLYNRIYSKGRYEDLWFMWDGKPLIMAYADALDKSDAVQNEISLFFTFKENCPFYFAGNTTRAENTWGWCSDYPQTKYGTSPFRGTEEMCVSVAQNAADGKLVAMNAESDNVQGRSFTHGKYSYSFIKDGKKVTVDKSTENAMCYGLNFQQQWDYAIRQDPEFVFVTGWNEWVAGRHEEWEGTKNAFPDECNDEYSRDIEPSAGALKDHYYYQLVANVRKFKGMKKADCTAVSKTIDINGSDSQWDSIANKYVHYTGGTKKRDCHGWVGLQYQSDTLRNDCKSAKITYDADNIYFRIETANDITEHTDSAWMRILIDTGGTSESGWEGFDYIINRNDSTDRDFTIEAFNDGWHFTSCGSGSYNVCGKFMYLQIPRAALGLDKNNEVHFSFKLSDNMQSDGDIMDFYKYGDVAPGGRFKFVF